MHNGQYWVFNVYWKETGLTLSPEGNLSEIMGAFWPAGGRRGVEFRALLELFQPFKSTYKSLKPRIVLLSFL